jgi:uncharacterized protein (TIGR00251 family)
LPSSKANRKPVSQKPDRAIVSVRVQPRSSKSKIVVEGDIVRVWVSSPPVDGEANRAVCESIAKKLKIAAGRVSIVGGATNRNKKVGVAGMTLTEAMTLLSADSTL